MGRKSEPGVGQRVMVIDVMRFFYSQERFVKTLKYRYWPAVPLDLNRLYLFVIRSLPSLTGKRIKCYFEDPAVESITFTPPIKREKKGASPPP